MDVIDISVAKKYTDDTVAGAGAVAGKPCQIQSITDITGGHRVTFLWVDNSSVSHTSTMDVMDGEKGDDGLGIKSVAVNSSNHLIVTYDDDTTEDAGEVTLDTSDFVQKSSTAGLLKNDGTVDTNTYALASALNDKVDKVTGKGLSTNDYDNTAKTKLDGLANIKSVGTGLSLNSGTGELTATGGGGGGTWGSITGTLSDQTDLQTALDGKQATLIFDNVPTNGSNNPVKSDGIYDAINDVYGVMGQNGAVNHLENKLTAQSQQNVSITINPDKSFTLNGTSSDSFVISINGAVYLEDGDYRFSVGFEGTASPLDGSHKVALKFRHQNDAYWAEVNTSYSDDQLFTFDSSVDSYGIMKLEVSAGMTFTNFTVKPMIAPASYTGDYVPYAMPNRELTEVNDIQSSVSTGSQSNYTLGSTKHIYKCGKFVEIAFDITRSAASQPPSGQGWSTLLTGLPNSLLNGLVTVLSPNGGTDYPVQLYVSKTGVLSARGGTQNITYSIFYTYICE